MNKEKLPITYIQPREIDRGRVEGVGTKEDEKWVLTGDSLKQQSKQLSLSFNKALNSYKEKVDKQTSIPLIFVANMMSKATSKSRRKYISSLFNFKHVDNVIGLVDSNSLLVKLDSLSQMDEISTRINDAHDNRKAISCLDGFSEYTPKVQEDDENTVCKIKLIDFQDKEKNLEIQYLFEETLSSKNIDFKKTEYAYMFYIYKIQKNSKVIEKLLFEEDIFRSIASIEEMPRFAISLDCVRDESDVEIKTPIEGERYETLGILDTGVSSIPHLSPWIEEKRWAVYPETSLNLCHGTAVASVALYGDELEEKDWVHHRGFKIYDAAIYPDINKESFDEDDLIMNIREIVKQKSRSIKIWNLSSGSSKSICDTKYSDFGIALDDIQERNNVLICKSAGNSSSILKKERIKGGSDSVRSLTVGSVAHTRREYDLVEKGNPSPFSCIGPGPEFIIKPEVSHYGGNSGFDGEDRKIETGVNVFSPDGTVDEMAGTSFSTPRVSALAIGLYQELEEDFDPLLLKALIIHSASYPETLNTPTEDRTNEMGFGIPKNIPQILYNKPFESTLILRGELQKGDRIDILDFPMPKSLISDGFYTGQITATLVYNPVLDRTQGIEYCQSNLEVRLGSYDEKTKRDTEKPNILNPIGRKNSHNILVKDIYSKPVMKNNDSEFSLRERQLIKYGGKYYPVKKFAVDLSELTPKNKEKFTTSEKQWYLSLQGLFRNHSEQKAEKTGEILRQEYCLIITIRDPECKRNIYDDVIQALDANNFIHNHINISNDINITTNQ